MLILVLVLSFGSVAYAVEDRNVDLTPDFQVEPFSSAEAVNAVSDATTGGIPDATGAFQAGGDTSLGDIRSAVEGDSLVSYAHNVGEMTVYNNNPGGFVINADGANNSESTYKLYHSSADNSGEHIMTYTLASYDYATGQETSGFGIDYGEGNNLDVD